MKEHPRTSGKTLPLSPKVGRLPRRACGWRFLPVVLLLASFAGCTSFSEYVSNGFKVGPNYYRPAAPVGEQWLDANDPSIDGGPMVNAAWWQNFHDQILDSLVSSACQQNLSIRAAGLRIMQARAQRAIVAGSLFPQSQTLDGSYTRNGLSENVANGGINFNDFTLGGSLAWELDFWGRFRRSLEAADANLDASVESYDQVLVILLSDVATAYSNVRIAEQRIAYAKQNVDIQQGSLKLAEDRFRHGAVTRLDVTQAISNLEQTVASLRPLEANRRQAVNQLCTLMGIPPRNLDEMLAAHQGIPRASGHLAIGLPNELLRRRPDVRKAERDVAAQSALIGYATSDLYPHFSLTGTIGVDSLDIDDLFEAESVAGSVGPSFTWNVLNYGRLLNNIRLQQYKFQQLVVDYQNTVLQANAEAENAIINYLKTQQQVQSLAKSAEASRESVDLVSAQYREGIVDFNRVFLVQQSLTQQEDGLAVAEGQVATYLIQLYRALGGGWLVRLDYPSMQFPIQAGEPVAAPAVQRIPTPQDAPMPPAAPPATPRQP